LSGNFGVSLVSHQGVTHELAQRMSVTIELAVLAAGISVALGVPLGLVTALRSRSAGRSALGRLASSAGMSLPDFVVGSIAVYLFSRYALGLTIGDYTPISESLGANLRSILLPALVLAVFATSAIARTTRDAVLGVLVEPYVLAAVARGESPGYIVRHHLLRNAATPVVIVASTVTAQLLGGVVIVESLFNLPGVGLYVVQAISRRDYAVVEACVLLAAAVFVVTNMTVDVAAGVIDPRVSARARRAR
jgi:peptide/nickel transport system permease protein